MRTAEPKGGNKPAPDRATAILGLLLGAFMLFMGGYLIVAAFKYMTGSRQNMWRVGVVAGVAEVVIKMASSHMVEWSE